MSIDYDLEPVYLLITQANIPEDIFGTPPVYSPENQRENIKEKFEKFQKIVNPESYTNITDEEYAEEAYTQLENFRVEALKKVEQGQYGLSMIFRNQAHTNKSFQVGTRTYYLGKKFCVGDMFTFYNGYFDLGETLGKVIIKITNTPEYNELIGNEVRILEKLHELDLPQKRHLPIYMNRFSSGGRDGIIFRKIGGHDFNEVKSQYSKGINQKHMVWMIDRLLSLLGYTHRLGIIHGRINPSRVMIRTKSHNVFLFNWGTALCDGSQKRYSYNDFDKQFLAPEYINHGEIGTWTDIYSLGKLIIWILGGNTNTDKIPKGVEPKICNFLQTMVQKDPIKRPHDAWMLYEQLNTIKDSLWEREYLRFDMQN